MTENNTSQNITQITATFNENNPDFSLIGSNLYQAKLLDELNWEGLDKENTLENLRAYQRLMKICDDSFVIQSLLDNGLNSSHHIASMTEDGFVAKYASRLNISEELARKIYKNAEAVKAKTMLLWANVKDVVASPHYSTMKVNNISKNITEFFEALPSYQELFGSLDYFEVDESKSIFGAAAYFVDLMRIVEEYIEEKNSILSDHTLSARRPDLKKILLTPENTYKTVPYLKIVNEVLVNAVKNYPQVIDLTDEAKEKDEEELFKSFVTSKYPFNLPFNLPLEQIRTYLAQLNVKLADVLEVFDGNQKQTIEFSREYLNISKEEQEIITTPTEDGIGLSQKFGFNENLITSEDNIKSFLSKTKLNLVEKFKVKTGLDETEVNELFKLTLGEDEESKVVIKPIFINNGMSTKETVEIITKKDDEGIEYTEIINLDFNKLDRINRFIRLARKLEWSFRDLDLVLTSLEANEINDLVLIQIAMIKKLIEKYKLSVIELCNLWYDIRNLGATTEKECRDIIINSVATKKTELQVIAEYLFNNSDIVSLNISDLAAVYRHGWFAKVLKLTAKEYVLLLTILDKKNKKVFKVAEVVEIFETVEWMKKSKINSYDIDFILNGTESLYVSKLYTDEKINQFIAGLQLMMKSVYVNEKSFIVPEFNIDEKLSSVVYKKLVEYGLITQSGIVLLENQGLLNFKKWNDFQYEQIFGGLSQKQSQHIMNILKNQMEDQEEKLASQLGTFFGAKEDIVAASIKIGKNVLKKYGSNWVKIFEDSSIGISLDGKSPDIIKKIMNTLGRHVVLAQRLKLKGKDLESIFENHFAYNLNRLERLTLQDLRNLFQFKQLTLEFGDDLKAYFKTSNEIMSADDISNYINKQFDDKSVAILMKSVQNIMKPHYINIESFVNDSVGIDKKLSEQIFRTIVNDGIIDDLGIVLVERIGLNDFKTQYGVQYQSLCAIGSKEVIDFAINKLMDKRDIQQYILLEELATFFNVSIEMMDVLIKIVSKVLIEYIQNSVKLFIDNVPDLDNKVSTIIKKFMAVASLYIVIIKKLRLDASELEVLFLDNGTKDIKNLKSIGLNSIISIDGFNGLIDKIRDKNGVNNYDGSFSLVKDERLISEMNEALRDITCWDVNQVRELCNFFFESNNCITLSDVLALKKVFDLSDKIGVDVYFLKELYSFKDLPSLSGSWNVYKKFSNTILEAVKSKYSTKAWEGIYTDIKSTIELKKRDKLLTAAIWKIGQTYSDINDSNSLYKYLLLDVDMGSEAQISYIKQGLNSIQLYLHRCRMNLEKGVATNNIPEVWWEWIMSYRVWEANRKVFLYPENYIDPSLRKTKTSLFKSLEESLMQSEITEESTEAAFKKYLDDFSQLAKLKYIDSYYCTVDYPHKGKKDTLFLFARTQTSPFTYYFCTREQDDILNGDEAAIWTEWKKIDMTINAEYITPVYAFNRLFIFWVEMKEVKNPGNDGETVSKKATIKYSFYNFSGNWVAPQSLVEDKVIHYKPIKEEDKLENKIKDSSGKMPFKDKFNLEDLFWKKVYAMNVSSENYDGDEPEGTAKCEKIAVMYGPLLMITSEDKMLGSLMSLAPTVVKGNEKSEFDGNLYSQALNYNRIKDFSQEGYLPLNDAMIINASLQKDFLLRSSEFLTLAMNEGKGVFKPGVDKLNNSLYVTSSHSIIHDNYIGEFISNDINVGEKAVLFSSVFSSNGKIVTVKNQPGMFIYDNGDETFLITPNKEGEKKKNLFNQISKSYKINLASPILKDNSFVGTVINEEVSDRIYKSLVERGILDSNGKINEKFISDPNYLLLSLTFKEEKTNLTEIQINEVKRVLASKPKGQKLEKSSFETPNISINNELSNSIFQMLTNEGIIDDTGKVTAKYDRSNPLPQLKACLQGAMVKLLDEQINLVKDKLSNVAETTTINQSTFIYTTMNRSIDSELSKEIFGNLVDIGLIEVDGKLVDEFYDNKHLLLVSICISLSGVYLSKTKLEIISDTLRATKSLGDVSNIDPAILELWKIWFPWILESLGSVNKASFVTKIDGDISKKVYYCLKECGILDAQGKLNNNYKEDELISSLSKAPLNLHIGKVRAIGSMLAKNMSKAEMDSFITTTIDSNLSNRIFKDLKTNGILDSDGRICPNMNRNMDLSTALSYLDQKNKDFVKKVLIDLFVPVMIQYNADNNEVDYDKINFTVTRISTGAFDNLSGNLFSGGIDKLLSLESQKEPKERKLMFKRFKPTSLINVSNAFLSDGAQVDFNGPYGIYYWELFFHAPMMIAMKLNSNQKFSEAQKWFKYIFDPTIAPIDDDNLKYKESHHWQFLPFRSYTIESLVEMLQNKQEISIYNNEPFDPHAIARLRLGAYEKAVVMACIDNLIDWGDYLFSQYTWESITEATMLYMYAYDLLGSKPRNVGSIRTQKPATFEEIDNKYKDEIPQFLIDLENILSSSPVTGVPGTKKPFNDIYSYFSVPGNSQFASYWDRVEDRLFKIRHSLNIKGEKQLLALFEPEIDPMQLARAVGGSNSLADARAYLQSQVPYYHFDYMLDKAKEVTSTVIDLGASLLDILEKNDAEALALLASTQEINILNMTTMQKEKSIDDLLRNLEGLNENLNGVDNRYKTYKSYIDNGLSGHEIASQVLNGVAIAPMAISNIMRILAVAGHLSPKIFGLAVGGMEFGDAVGTAAEAIDGIAGILTHIASMIETNGEYARRKDDWTLEMKSADYEIKQIRKSIESAKIQIEIAKQDLAIHLKTIDQAKENENFLKSKFTNKDLYSWMLARVSSLYFQTYKLALDLALKAQRAYQYETASNDSFINFGYWDSLKKGLLAGEGLMNSLQQMDSAFMSNDSRSLEIEKTVSLLQINPIALMELKNTGKCIFNLDEELYDYDFPGHYCRQIKSISISIPAVVGPYQNVNAMLTQISNAVILDTDEDAVEYMLKRGQDATSIPSPDVLRENWMMSQKVAITKGIDDSGLFVLDFNDERFLPFEGTGAVSTWKLSMPKETNRINFDTISDIIIKIKYTAIDGGEEFTTKVKEKLSSVGRNYVVFKHFDLKQEFTNAWYTFVNSNPVAGKKIFKFVLPKNILLPNSNNASLQGVLINLLTEEGTEVSDNPRNGSFVKLTVGDTPIRDVNIPILKNVGIADEDNIIGANNFTGEWMLEFDLNKAPQKIISDGNFNADILKDLELVISYEITPFSK